MDTVFGYPGGTILNVYDELYNYRDKIHHVLTAHEQGASHAADGYARSTGKVGVCFATSGPGATNLTTGHRHRLYGLLPGGVHHLQRDGGHPGEGLLPGGGYHRHCMPITKATYLVRDPRPSRM